MLQGTTCKAIHTPINQRRHKNESQNRQKIKIQIYLRIVSSAYHLSTVSIQQKINLLVINSSKLAVSSLLILLAYINYYICRDLEKLLAPMFCCLNSQVERLAKLLNNRPKRS